MTDPLTKPRTEPDRTDDPRPFQRRQADAISELVHHWHGLELPDNPQRKRPDMIIRVDYDHTTGELSTGTLDTGEHLSPQLVAKLSCDADLTTVWMANGLIPVAVASTHRFFNGRQRAALIARDNGCVFPDCDRPVRWCHAHHTTPFKISRRTTAHDGVLLCSFHHDLIHQGDWTVRIAADGIPEFTPPAWINPAQTPLRHQRHQR